MVGKRISIRDIRKLYYTQGLSVLETAYKLGKTSRQIFRYMRNHNLPRRTFSQTMRIKFYKSPLSYDKKTNLTAWESRLLLSALMLYWAEGYKAKPRVDFSNSNPHMVFMFLSSLRSIYRVDPTRVRINLYCYSNQDVRSLIKYWSNFLMIPINQFEKPYIRSDYKLDKIGKMTYGLVHIRYSDRRLHEQIMSDIDKIVYKFSRDIEAVKRA